MHAKRMCRERKPLPEYIGNLSNCTYISSRWRFYWHWSDRVWVWLKLPPSVYCLSSKHMSADSTSLVMTFRRCDPCIYFRKKAGNGELPRTVTMIDTKDKETFNFTAFSFLLDDLNYL